MPPGSCIRSFIRMQTLDHCSGAPERYTLRNHFFRQVRPSISTKQNEQPIAIQ